VHENLQQPNVFVPIKYTEAWLSHFSKCITDNEKFTSEASPRGQGDNSLKSNPLSEIIKFATEDQLAAYCNKIRNTFTNINEYEVQAYFNKMKFKLIAQNL